jgi:nucleoside 2-deoxyribosyltransferase
MKGVFISYRFSDIPKDDLEKLIDPVYDIFKKNGADIFCNFYKDATYIENKYTAKQIMEDCFKEIDKRDHILCLVDTDKYSCGMLLEIGYALAKNKRILVCFRKGCEIDTLGAMANKVIVYEDYDELFDLLLKIEKKMTDESIDISTYHKS